MRPRAPRGILCRYRPLPPGRSRRTVPCPRHLSWRRRRGCRTADSTASDFSVSSSRQLMSNRLWNDNATGGGRLYWTVLVEGVQCAVPGCDRPGGATSALCCSGWVCRRILRARSATGVKMPRARRGGVDDREHLSCVLRAHFDSRRQWRCTSYGADRRRPRRCRDIAGISSANGRPAARERQRGVAQSECQGERRSFRRWPPRLTRPESRPSLSRASWCLEMPAWQ